eukprot:PhM_4_TR8678/c0_g1_i1/m.76432
MSYSNDTIALTSEVTHLISALESKMLLIDREIVDIATDIERTRLLFERYGDVYRAPLMYLTDLRGRKVAAKQDIMQRLGMFEQNLERSTHFARSLSQSQQY